MAEHTLIELELYADEDGRLGCHMHVCDHCLLDVERRDAIRAGLIAATAITTARAGQLAS